VGLDSLLIYTGLAIASLGLSVLLSLPFFRKTPLERRKVLRFSMIYTNCGFMGIPLVEAILGSTGVVYAAIHCAVFYLFIWSHGVVLMSGEKRINFKKLLLNPGTIGIAVGVPLFILSIRIPSLIETPIENFSSLNTPLAMIVIGSYISRVELKELFTDIELYKLSVLRLLFVPAVAFVVLLPFGLDKTAATTVLLLTAAPTGANAAMFAAQFGADTKLGSKAVALTSILSILTMPIFSALAQQFL
jgi:predicted permease